MEAKAEMLSSAGNDP